MKKCFDCSITYPLFMFSKNRMKYAREDDKGRVKVCRICCYKQWSKDGYTWRFNHDSAKFQKTIFKSKLEILKQVLK
jgi:hypothetical protein